MEILVELISRTRKGSKISKGGLLERDLTETSAEEQWTWWLDLGAHGSMITRLLLTTRRWARTVQQHSQHRRICNGFPTADAGYAHV